MGAIIDVPTTLLQKAGVKDEKNARLIVYGVIVVASIIGVALLVHQVKKFLGKTTEKVDKHNSTDSTITNDDAQSIADRLWNNMHQNLIVTFSSLMTDVPNPEALTVGDKAKIYNAFGIRNTGFPFYTKGDMYFWMDRRIKFGTDDAKAYWGF